MLISKLLDLKGRAVATIGPDETVADALRALSEHGIGALVVASDGRHIEGILSERDIVRALGTRGPALTEDRVDSLMSTEVVSCLPDGTVEDLMSVMTMRRIRHVPVLDKNGELCGIVSIGDVVKTRIDELEKDRRELVDYINAR